MVIAATISGIFGIAFLCWGIYQIKTGKMVAKHHDYTVDEPREIGVLFHLLKNTRNRARLKFLISRLRRARSFRQRSHKSTKNLYEYRNDSRAMRPSNCH